MFGAPSTMRRALVVPTAVALLTLFGGAVAHGSAESFDECVRRKTSAGTERAVAVAECATSTNNGQSNNSSASSDDGGTSIGALLAAGVAGAVVGAGAMVLRSRQRGAGGAAAGVAAPAMAPPAMAAPVGMPPPGAMAAPAPAADARVDSLVNALIDLGDRVNSTALRAEIVAALAAAGVQALEPPPGTPFDASRMRGVGNSPAPSPAAIGTVATTDRVGYASATRVLRLPDVVVYTAS